MLADDHGIAALLAILTLFSSVISGPVLVNVYPGFASDTSGDRANDSAIAFPPSSKQTRDYQ